MIRKQNQNLTYSTYYPPNARQTYSGNKNFIQRFPLRMSLPKEIAEKLNVSESEHIGFYEVKGEIVVRKIE